MKKILVTLLILTGCHSGAVSTAQTNKLSQSTSNNTTKEIQSINISALPEFSFVPGTEHSIIDYGKFEINYTDGSAEEKDINQDNYPEVDFFTSRYQISYLNFNAEVELNISSIMVSANEELAPALMSEEKLIFIKSGAYQLTAGNATYITKNKYIIGQEGTAISVNGQTAGQAAIIFARADVTIENITFIATDQKDNLKFINSEKAYLKNVELIGAGGLDAYDSKLNFVNSSIIVDKNYQTAALKISNSEIWLTNAHVTYGVWGAIGIMYHEDQPFSSKLVISSDSTIDYVVYIENYEAYHSLVEIIGLELWDFIIIPQTLTGIYYLPEHLTI